MIYNNSKVRSLLYFVATVALFLSIPSLVSATHSWGGYHWARTSNPFNLNLADNLSSIWDPFLITTSSDWSQSSVLDTTIVAGTQSPRRCRPKNGRVEVCNYRYGNNGWLGLAQIWVSGLHITQGVTKMNDTYFTTSTYNTPAWRNLVVCQEVGHTLGLDHQDENFNNSPLGTCMDYTIDPTPNQHPNAHDFEELELIYAHLDNTTTVSQTLPKGAAQVDVEDRREWGKELKNNKKVALYERDFGRGHKVFTFVIWAQE